jgi:outer membrane protein OmpA-like peptidoglycan-associated protein
VTLYKKRGGTVRVVGHASSRTKDLDPYQHRLVNLRISMDRANSVARGLRRLGIPANKIITEAKSDNNPVYQEVMPAGEAGNRRVEIYLDN